MILIGQYTLKNKDNLTKPVIMTN